MYVHRYLIATTTITLYLPQASQPASPVSPTNHSPPESEARVRIQFAKSIHPPPPAAALQFIPQSPKPPPPPHHSLVIISSPKQRQREEFTVLITKHSLNIHSLLYLPVFYFDKLVGCRLLLLLRWRCREDLPYYSLNTLMDKS